MKSRKKKVKKKKKGQLASCPYKKKKIVRKKKGPQSLGAVTHYFKKINVAVIKLKASLKVGNYIRFKTSNGEFTQIVDSMQVNHKNIMGARKGSEIGLKVLHEVKEGDAVFIGEEPKPIVIEEKIEYTPLFSLKPSNPEPPKPKPSHHIFQPPPRREKPKGFSHPLIKDKSAGPAEPHPHREPQRKPSKYRDVKFLKF